MPTDSGFETQDSIRGPWRQYLDDLSPLRPELLKVCLRLTGNVWDAEDLLQEALLRVFSLLGKTDAPLHNPKAYLTRTAANLWIDQIRAQARADDFKLRELADQTQAQQADTEVAAQATEASEELFSRLFPQERAAVLMKDVLDYSLQEIAAVLDTTVGAVKSALHRGRGRLNDGTRPSANFRPDKAVVEQFLQALQRADLEQLANLCRADLRVDMVGGAEMNSFDESKTFFAHAHFVMPEIGFGENPHWQYVEYLGEPMVLGFRTLDGVEGLNEIHRLQTHDGVIVRIRCYCFSPDVLGVVAQDLGYKALSRPYRSPS